MRRVVREEHVEHEFVVIAILPKSHETQHTLPSLGVPSLHVLPEFGLQYLLFVIRGQFHRVLGHSQPPRRLVPVFAVLPCQVAAIVHEVILALTQLVLELVQLVQSDRAELPLLGATNPGVQRREQVKSTDTLLTARSVLSSGRAGHLLPLGLAVKVAGEAAAQRRACPLEVPAEVHLVEQLRPRSLILRGSLLRPAHVGEPAKFTNDVLESAKVLVPLDGSDVVQPRERLDVAHCHAAHEAANRLRRHRAIRRELAATSVTLGLRAAPVRGVVLFGAAALRLHVA